MAYIGTASGTEPRLFEAVEYGPHDDPRQKSPLATTNSALLINGGTAAPMRDYNFALIAPTTGYFYSAETVTTGFYVGGTQIKLCKPGCRPRSATLRWASGASGTAYINRFTDGEVWISPSANSRSGTQISYKTSGTTLPRGISYLIAHLCGGGGGGGKGGLLVSSYGGGGGACLATCVRLPANGYVTLTVGAAGKGATALLGTGEDGGDSRLTIGGNYVTAQGGKGGQYNSGGGEGGVVGTNAAGSEFRYILGNDGAHLTGGAISYTDHAPEGGTYTQQAANGGGGGGAGYGNGGDGGPGKINLYY